MEEIAVFPKRELRALGELCDAVNDVESSLDAICELLRLADGARVQANGIHALLKPLRIRLREVTDDLADQL